jgi:hypothetical protein
MPNTPAEAKVSRRRRNWRHSENRASPKLIAKRVSEDDHRALVKYAEDHGVKVSQMLEPFVADLIKRAHEHCEQHGDVTAAARAS